MIESLPLFIGAGGGGGAKLARASVLDMPTALGNINSLSQSLTIGGTAYAPTAYLVADDINPTTGAWASRHDTSKTLAVTGAGAAPTYGNASAITNTAVKYQATKYHKGADTTWGQIATGDGAIEIVINNNAANGYHFSTSSAAGGEHGFIVYYNGLNRCYFHDGSGGTAVGLVNAATTPGIAHLMFFFDRSYHAYMYSNGLFVQSADISALTDTLVGSPLVVGAAASGEAPSSASILQAAIWDMGGAVFPGAATNRAVMDAIAAERFETIAGIYDRKRTAYSFVRTSAGYLDRYTTASRRSLFAVSAGWPRVCERADNTATKVTGYLAEPQCTNDFLYSQDFAQAATWEPTRCSVGSNSAEAPDGTLTADSIIADAADNTHYLQQTITSDAGVTDIFSVWLKYGACTWARIDTHISTNAYAYFDLGNGVPGAVGADTITSGMEDWGNSWYRCWITYTGGVASHTHHIHPCTADDDQTFAGDGATASIYVWGAQHENDGTVIPSSYILTAAAAATRIKDSLTRAIAVTTGKVSVEAETLLGPVHNNTQVKTVVMLDDASANNVIDASVSANDVSVLTVTTGGGAAQAAVTGSQDITNGKRRSVAGKIKTNYVTQLIDGTADGTVDVVASTAASYTVCRVGCAGTGLTQQPLGTVGKVKVYKDVI